MCVLVVCVNACVSAGGLGFVGSVLSVFGYVYKVMRLGMVLRSDSI